jgi:hypothetical protein
MTGSTLDRLRAANPLPTPRHIDDPELFARITAVPQDRPRAARSRRRRAVTVAIAVALTALLASTAFAISHWAFPAAVKPAVTKREYRHAQHRLVLPPGYSWPALHVPADSVTSPGAGGGHAVLIAQNAWECYWVNAIHAGAAAKARRAHAELNALLAHHVIEAPAGASEDWTPPHPPDAPYAIFAHDGGLQWIRQTYALAAADHPQRLIASCRANGGH